MTGLLEGDPMTYYLVGLGLGFLLGVVVTILVIFWRSTKDQRRV